MKHNKGKSLSNTDLAHVSLTIRKQSNPLFTSSTFNDPFTPHNAFRQESIKELLRSMKSLQISMMTQSSIDNMTQMQISNHASSTAKRLSRIIQRSNDYYTNLNNEENQNYLIDNNSQWFFSSKTPKAAMPSFINKKYKELLSLNNNPDTKPNTNLNTINSQCDYLNTDIKVKPQYNNNNSSFVPKQLFDQSNQFNSPLNEKLTINPEIKKKLEEYKKKRLLLGNITEDHHHVTKPKNKPKHKKVKTSIEHELKLISTIQQDANKHSRQISKEILNEKKLPSITSSRSKAQKATKVLLKVSSAYLETSNRIGKEIAKQNIQKAQNDYNIKSSYITKRAIDSLIINDDKLKARLGLEVDNNQPNKKQHSIIKSFSNIEITQDGFENINWDQKLNYNESINYSKKTERQKFIRKMKKQQNGWNDNSFLKEETAKNHILKSLFPRMVKYSKANSVNVNIK